jgi:hypothetical protein
MTPLSAAALLLVALGCSEEPEILGPAERPPPPPPEATELPDVSLVEADAEALWSYLETVDYREHWPLWPNTQPLYDGSEPHGAVLTTYVNELARRAIVQEADTMPMGAIIVKENYTPERELARITVMYKVGGEYDPAHNDWYWLERLADGTPAAAGRVERCIACHQQKAYNDFLFTSEF